MTLNAEEFLEPRIQRGLKLLDNRCPGWENRIDPNSLDIYCLHGCLLGQIYGDFYAGVCELFGPTLNPERTYHHGFDTEGNLHISTHDQANILEHRWGEIIRARRQS